jgi:hypothetical protein
MMGVFVSARPGPFRAVVAAVLVLLAALSTPLSGLEPANASARAPGLAGAALAAEGDPVLWAVGGSGQDEARHLAVDAAGAIYLAGLFSATLDIDPGPETNTLTSAGNTDIYLAKYDPSGGLVWAFGIGGPGVDQVYQVAVDPFGNAYLAGSFADEVDFAPGDAVAAARAGGERDGFVAKYGPTGELLWVTPLNPIGDDAVLALSLDSAGNVVAAGIAGAVALTPEQAGGRVGVRRGDAFAFRLNPDGQLTWSSILPTSSEGVDPVGLAAGRAGEIYLATTYTGTVRVAIGNGLIDETSKGGTDLLLMRIGPTGNLDWSKTVGGAANVTPGTGGLALDRAGNLLIAGTFDGILDMGGDGLSVLESKGQGDLFVASYTPDGALRWATGIGGPEPDGGMRVVADAAGYVYVAGWSSGDLPAMAGEGGQVVMGRRQPGGTDALLAKWTPDGRLAWAHGFGGQASGPGQSSLGSSVAVDPWGDVLLAGRFFGADVGFDPLGGAASLRSAGQSDGFVAKYGPDGSLIRR